MAFSRFHQSPSSFNLALLAKQGWRILRNPNSLVTRVLKSRYFRGSEFLKTKGRSNSSYIWKSILHERNLLAKGIIWRIGDGNDVNVWDDPWVPIPFSFRVSQIHRNIWPDAKVGDLINHQQGTWKQHFLRALFLSFEAEYIANIPLAPFGHKDELIWFYTKNGHFSVKSAYHLAQNLKRIKAGVESSSSNQTQGFWKQIWHLNVPPKVKTFIWRASSDILPTGFNLNKRLKGNELKCHKCGCQMETDKHVFLECDFATEVWQTAGLQQLHLVSSFHSFKDWLDGVLNSQGKEMAEYVAILTWLIWKARNDRIFRGSPGNAGQLSKYAEAYLQEYKLIHGLKREHRPAEVTSWRAPDINLLKINVDGAFSDSGAGIGVVVRNHLGEVEAAMGERIQGALNAEHTECLAVLQGLRFARDFGISHFILESDAQNVVRRINANSIDLSLFGNLINSAKNLLQDFVHGSVTHVSRKNNGTAHVLAKMSLSFEGSRVWFMNFPKQVLYYASKD